MEGGASTLLLLPTGATATLNRELDTRAKGCYTRLTMRHYRIKRPPRALRRPGVRLDNVALVPASLLPVVSLQ